MTTTSASKDSHGWSRRDLLAGTAGLSFAFAFGSPALFGANGALAQSAGRLNAYVTIAPDGAVTIMMPAPEMGQGVILYLKMFV
jgi:isoquinoline 1-oxidoreductase beta subunit